MQYLRKNQLTVPSLVPIQDPKTIDVPIAKASRWIRTRDDIQGVEKLVKEYTLTNKQDKIKFIKGLLSYESETYHTANVMHVTDSDNNIIILLELWTENIKQVTELDKEYAHFADLLYRNITYD